MNFSTKSWNLVYLVYLDWTSFVSNVLQQPIYKTYVLPSFRSDHSPILFALDMTEEDQRGKGL